jgi:hypothetical protein
MRTFKIFCLLYFLIISGPSLALTGNELFADLKRNDVSYEHGYSSGFLFGAVQKSVLETKKIYCIPPGVTQRQLIDVTINYLQNSPEIRNLPAIILIEMGFMRAWPCSK